MNSHSDAGADADAVIIGAGVIGSSVAYELAKRGLRVTVVDKLPAAGYGSTSSSSAVVRFHYSTEASVAMSWEGLHYWLDWDDHVAAATVSHESLAEYVSVPVVMFLDSSEPRPPYVGHFDTLGIPYELRPASEVDGWPMTVDVHRFGPPARLDDTENPFWGEPAPAFDQVLIMDQAGYVSDPQLAAQNLATAAAASGARFRYRTEVVAIERAEPRAARHADGRARVTGVRLADGTGIQAPIVVNVAGPHSLRINQLAGVTDDMARRGRPLRREVYIGPAPAGFDSNTGFMVGDLDIGVYYRPERGDNILVGSTEPECDELEWVEDPDSYDETLTEDEFQLSMMRTARRFPDLGIPHSKRGLVALYDASEDWTPLYDRSSLDGFYMACGSSGNQFKNAGIAGHVMAELITAVEGGHDHDTEPLVVAGPHTGLAIDLATFSRRRPVDPDAANTVLG
jgi:glycine/D-amino acid oxidase-like deaminating enzyme